MVKKCGKCNGKPIVGSCNLCGDSCCTTCLESFVHRKTHCQGYTFCVECSTEFQTEFKKCPSPCSHVFYGDLSIQTQCQCCLAKVEEVFIKETKQNLCPLEFQQKDSMFSVSGKTYAIKEFLKKEGFQWNPDSKIWYINQPNSTALKEKIIQAYHAS